VTDLKISYRKLNELQYECYQNALRLHFDSVLLAKARSFASAFAISVIASEELGKGFGIEEMSFQAGQMGGLGRIEEKKYLRALLSDHKLKQAWFVSSFLIGISISKSVLKRYQNIQTAKNNAIYVGVKKGNHQIVRPFLVSASKAKQQIRTVNDALIELVEARLRDGDCDAEVFDQVFRRRRLLNRLVQAAKALR
jgi:AbiV family abortive infection protein